MNGKALLIVDVQNDFLPSGALPVNEGNEIIPLINQLQPLFDLVVATKDWHPRNHCSFATVHGKEPGEIVMIQGRRQELWPEHCIQNTHGSEFSDQLNTEKIAQVFYKGIDPHIDSYSAFFDNARLRSTGLGEYLKKHQIKEVFIVGLATDYCVKYSAHDAIHLGFSVSIILDACRGIELNPGDVRKAIQEMREAGAHILSSSEIMQ